MERRLKAVEDKIVAYGRRHDDCEKERAAMVLTLAEIVSWKETIQDATEVSRKLVEVGENLLIATHWIAMVCKWVITVGGAFVAFYNAFKWIAGRFH